ncbi:MAG: M18 family aminopeptidase [Anaeroplasmataceae bacterium]|nr:M18 family aminopeptidase [Anaeroplasmataceae bacterium]MDE6415079.1 M18 family aminopeptidase [Anaeroplasmataceae bacterium]
MKEFLEFIKDTPTAFHASLKIKEKLLKAGFIELKENESWKLTLGGKYFIGRNMSSLLAFVLPKDSPKGFHITAAHLDSPTFKLKPNFTLEKGKYIKLNTEVYGGPIYSSWMDRPLGIAGRVLVLENNSIQARLVNIDKPVLCIPNLPIHYNRNVNKGVELNPQVDMLPLFAESKGKIASLYQKIAEVLDIKEEAIISSDLYLTCLDRGCFVGANEEFMMAPQIDNLECSYGLIEALLQSKAKDTVSVCALFDNEEIGSSTLQGADSTFLADTLKRISIALHKTEEEHFMALGNSFLISADNAQGFHPNYPSKYDESNPCFMNEGIVIKNAANGSYTTSALSSALFQAICKKAGVPTQLTTNRSDIRGGSTLGAISLTHVSIPSVDIGLAQLAMHSSYETAGTKDLAYLIQAIKEFYSSKVEEIKEEKITF